MRGIAIARIAGLAAVLPWALAPLGCGGGGGDAKEPYPRYSETTRTTFVKSAPGGDKVALASGVAGTKTINGKSFSVYRVGDDSSTTNGWSEMWGNLVDDTHIEIVGAQYSTTHSAILGIPIFASGTLDTPVTVDLDPPVGTPQPFQLTGSAVIGSQTATPQQSTVTGSYTLVEKDVTVESDIGTVSGCSHFQATGSLPLLFTNLTVAGDLYYSPTFGLVKAAIREPLSGLGVSFAGSNDASDLGGGYFSVQKVGTVGAGTSSWRLDTYDVKQKSDADKNTHAKMLLEVRWLDEAVAKTEQKPYVTQEFGTGWGYFPSALVVSPVSYFYPEENGKGYKHWIAYVDQAAKNEPGSNGISYHISAGYDPSWSAVRVTGRIVYKKYVE